MNDPAAGPPPSSKAPERTTEELRRLELGPALKRDQVLARVRAARKRLSQGPPGALARLR